MNIWLTKNIRFGFRYTINKSMRGQINSCLHTWLDELLSKRAKDGDILVIFGGLFSNTNPSLVAIDDAHKFLRKVSEKITVYLINTDLDTRIFDEESYSTLDIFSDVHNVYVIKDITEFNQIDNLKELSIPNIMQLEETESRPGVLVYNLPSKKHMMMENNFSPKHVTFTINSLDDFSFIDKVKHKNDFIHVQLDNNLLEEKRLEVNIALHTINASSVKYVDRDKEVEIVEGITDITDSLNIVDTIFNHIGEDEKVKKQFERVLNVFKK
jgi:hypothetical protein